MKTKKIVSVLENMKESIKDENISLSGLGSKKEFKILDKAIDAVKENKKLRKEVEKLREQLANKDFDDEYPDGYTL